MQLARAFPLRARETHKIRQSGSSVRVGDAQFHQIHRSTALHELVLAPSLTPQAPAALASHASLFTPLKATGYCNDTLSHEPQTAAAAHSAAARHSRSVSSTKTRARDTSSIIKRENRSCSPLCGIERYREHILGRAKRGGGCDAAVRWSGQRTDSAYRLSKCSRR